VFAAIVSVMAGPSNTILMGWFGIAVDAASVMELVSLILYLLAAIAAAMLA
jgi:hypothetical protein